LKSKLLKTFFTQINQEKNADGSIRRGGLGLMFFDLYSLGSPTFGK